MWLARTTNVEALRTPSAIYFLFHQDTPIQITTTIMMIIMRIVVLIKRSSFVIGVSLIFSTDCSNHGPSDTFSPSQFTYVLGVDSSVGVTMMTPRSSVFSSYFWESVCSYCSPEGLGRFKIFVLAARNSSSEISRWRIDLNLILPPVLTIPFLRYVGSKASMMSYSAGMKKR